jgi:hypothetical protein
LFSRLFLFSTFLFPANPVVVVVVVVLPQLYEHFISGIEAKLNQLKLVQIVARICTQYYPSRPYATAGAGGSGGDPRPICVHSFRAESLKH